MLDRCENAWEGVKTSENSHNVDLKLVTDQFQTLSWRHFNISWLLVDRFWQSWSCFKTEKLLHPLNGYPGTRRVLVSGYPGSKMCTRNSSTQYIYHYGSTRILLHPYNDNTVKKFDFQDTCSVENMQLHVENDRLGHGETYMKTCVGTLVNWKWHLARFHKRSVILWDVNSDHPWLLMRMQGIYL